MTKREIWTQHVAQWRLSGLTREQYCVRHDLKAASLSWWTREFQGKPAAHAAPSTLAKNNTQVHMAQVVAPGKSSGIELRLGDVQMRIERGVDASTLRTVFELLKEMRCG